MKLTTAFSTVLSTAANFINKFSEPAQASQDKPFAFSFGDPEPVLDSANWGWLFPSSLAGNYYTHPVDLKALARLMKANPYHGPIVHKKKDLLLSLLNPTALMSRLDQERLVLDFIVNGNCYLQETYNGLGRVYGYRHKSALALFRGYDMQDEKKEFYLEDSTQLANLQNLPTTTTYRPGEIKHLFNAAVDNEIYGEPSYLGGVQSVLLSEASTLFRRKYYVNGSHMGYILVANDANFDDDTAKAIEATIKQGKGAGNFRSMFLNIPRSQSREPIKVIPIGNFATQDEYANISSVTEDQMCGMHQIPPAVACIVPANAGGFGKPSEALEFYYYTGIIPMQEKLMQFNDLTGKNLFSFKKPAWLATN